MKNGFKVLGLLFVFLSVTLLANAQNNSKDTRELFEKGTALLEKGEYDAVIHMVQELALSNPLDLIINWLLASAQLEKCELMKINHDANYKYLVMQPYEIGLRLLRPFSSRPEPYYLIARSLTLNDRPRKAYDYIKKALELSPPEHRWYAEFLMVLGDSFSGQLKKAGMARGAKDQDFYVEAMEAYTESSELRENDPVFCARIKKRMEVLEQVRH